MTQAQSTATARTWTNPETRAKRSAGIRKTIEANRANRGWLCQEQIDQMLEQYRRGDSVYGIAADWLISVQYVYTLAAKNGVRRKRKYT